MVIHPIKIEEDYRNAMLRIDALMDAEPGTEEGDELDVLATLVEAYERVNFPIASPDPVEAILFRMEQMEISRKALEPFLGGCNRVSEVLNRKRNLSMSQVRKLHDGLNILQTKTFGANQIIRRSWNSPHTRLLDKYIAQIVARIKMTRIVEGGEKLALSIGLTVDLRGRHGSWSANTNSYNYLKVLVGVRRFELPAPASRRQSDTR